MLDRKETLRRTIRVLQTALEKLEAKETAPARTQDNITPAKPPRYAFSSRWCDQHQRYELSIRKGAGKK